MTFLNSSFSGAAAHTFLHVPVPYGGGGVLDLRGCLGKFVSIRLVAFMEGPRSKMVSVVDFNRQGLYVRFCSA